MPEPSEALRQIALAEYETTGMRLLKYPTTQPHQNHTAHTINATTTYQSEHTRKFTPHDPAQNVPPTPSFTIQTSNQLGTKVTKHKKTLQQIKSQVGWKEEPINPQLTPCSVATTSYREPDLSDPERGQAAPRQGVAPPTPRSEVERGFTHPTSEGLAHFGGGPFDATSETVASHSHKPARVCGPQYVTIKCQNEIGTRVFERIVPVTELNATNYDLGDGSATTYVTSSMHATDARVHTMETAAKFAGGAKKLPISEIERDFRHVGCYNIITHE